MRSFVLIGCIILGIAILAAFYLRHARRTNKKLRNQAVYIEHLYNAVPGGLELKEVIHWPIRWSWCGRRRKQIRFTWMSIWNG